MESSPNITPEMSLADARLALSGYLPFSPRAQMKAYYRLFCRFVAEVPYARFKPISRGRGEPSSEAEADLAARPQGFLGWHWQLTKYNPRTGKTAGTIAKWLWWTLGRF